MPYIFAEYKYYDKNKKPIYFYTRYISTIDIPYRRYKLVEKMRNNNFEPLSKGSTQTTIGGYR